MQLADAAAGRDYTKTGVEQDWRKFHPASHKLLDGAVTVYDPALYEDTSAKVNLAVRGAVLAPMFFQYAPCLLFSQPYGFGMFPYGISIQPTGARLPLGRSGFLSAFFMQSIKSALGWLHCTPIQRRHVPSAGTGLSDA